MSTYCGRGLTTFIQINIHYQAKEASVSISILQDDKAALVSCKIANWPNFEVSMDATWWCVVCNEIVI